MQALRDLPMHTKTLNIDTALMSHCDTYRDREIVKERERERERERKGAMYCLFPTTSSFVLHTILPTMVVTLDVSQWPMSLSKAEAL